MKETTERSIETKIEVISEQIAQIKEEIRSINAKLDSQYITRFEFDPVKKLVYGLVSVVLTAVIGALLGLVIMK